VRAFDHNPDQPLNLNEELTVVFSRSPRLASVVLDIVPRSRAYSTSSREQMETSGAQ
jgi:hypothetical protein